MDYDRWMSQSHSLRFSRNNTQQEQLGSRYEHDMAQAELMKRSRPDSVPAIPSSGATAEDLALALNGLEQAKSHRLNGQLESALKLYELAIELLIQCLKGPKGSFDKTDRSMIEDKVQAALSDAEAIKAQLVERTKDGQRQRGQPVKQNSFQTISNALLSALGGTAVSKPAAKPAASALLRPNPASIARMQQQHHQIVRISPRSKNNALLQSVSTSATSTDPLKQNILSDFYVNPAVLQHTTWDDIAGLQNVKQALQEAAILPLLRPDLFTGLRQPQNILLYGPPGTGKTMLLRAVAQESGSSLFVCSASSLTSKWMGDSEKLVRNLFQVAQSMAPSILFMDEMDALLSSRKSDGGEHEASRRLKTEFMVQMDGIKQQPDQGQHLLLVACTNCPWDVDSAVLRRFPRRIFVPLPDADARKGLILNLVKKIGRHTISSRQVSSLVKKTEGFSCSDISAIASEASFGPLRSVGDLNAIRDCSVDDIRPVQFKDFDNVLKDATRSLTAEQIERFEEWRTQQQTLS
jgi:ATP-dependent 26S proteasome regulatory subunit